MFGELSKMKGDGKNAVGFGAGGSGAASSRGSGFARGGNGAPGIAVVTEYLSFCSNPSAM